MVLSRRVVVIVAVSALLIFGAGDLVCYRSQRAFLQRCREARMLAVAREVRTGIQSQARYAAAFAELVAELPSVRERLRAGERDRLSRELLPSFEGQKARYGAEQGIFYRHDLTAFLRLHDPRAFGDDVSSREILAHTNVTGAPQLGPEASASGFSIRAVAPIEDERGRVGGVAWGVGFGRLLARVKENTDAELALFVNELATTRGHKGADPDGGGAERSGFKLLESTNRPLLERLTSEEMLASVQEVLVRESSVDGVDYGVVAVPVHDFGGRSVGVIVGAENMGDVQHDSRALVETLVATLALGTAAVALVVAAVFRRLLQRPLTELEQAVSALADARLGPGSHLPGGQATK